MPAFTYIASLIAVEIGAWALGSFGLSVVTGTIATGLAYITSRIINGNPNKGNNANAGSAGGRIQVPPASNNKIPVLYGSAYVNGMITDARLINENKTMYYCIVLSETSNNVAATYTVDDIYWNDLRLTAVDATTNSHKILNGKKTVDGPGEDFTDNSFVVDNNSLVQIRVYAGSSASAKQIWPLQSTGNTTPAYTFWADNNGDWNSTYEMKGLVFAIVRVDYNGDKGFTGLPNMTFNITNSISNPADVWYDYMTSDRFGAAIDPAAIDTTANTAWRNFCAEDINYTNIDGVTNQLTDRYKINGIIDTAGQVKNNIDTILQNGGAWMSYNVATGLWSPVIKKAITAGVPGDATTYFTASRNSSSVITVSAFPAGRIEPGQLLYTVSGSTILARGAVVAQLTPLLPGESTGQIGRYSTTGTSFTFTNQKMYALAPNLLSFTDDNIISGITISSTRLEDLYNKVEVEFYDQYNKDQKAYARNAISTGLNPNEPENQLRMNLDLCNNSPQADIIGQLEMRQSRDDLVVEFTTNQYGIQAQAGDVIQLTNNLYTWAPKLFRVMRVKEQETEDGGLVAQIQALEYNPDVYTVEPITEFTTTANIGIGILVSSPGLPAPATPTITNVRATDSIPNFTYNVVVPSTGGPFDEIEIYYTEGWDDQQVTMSVAPGTGVGGGGNGVPVGKGLMTVTSLTYNSLNVGDYFTVPAITIESQLTQTTVSTKTFVSGGAIGAYTFVLNNGTDIKIGQLPTGTGIPTGAMVVAINSATVTLDKAFTVQAAGSYLFTTAGGRGTYQVDVSTTLASADRTLWDQPLDSDFKYLKKITPSGNTSAFTAGATVSSVITELPANSQTYRRYFLKSRMGWKKNFGVFSNNSPVDLDANVNWTPNPSGSGGDGLFGNIAIAKNGPRTSGSITNNVISSTAGDIYLDPYDGQVIITGSLFTDSIPISPDPMGLPNIFTVRSDNNNLPVEILSLTASYSSSAIGPPIVGFGPEMTFLSEIGAPNTYLQAGSISCLATDMTVGSEDFQIVLAARKNGATPDYKTYINSDGDIATDGNLILNYDQTAADAVITAYNSTNAGTLTWDGTTWKVSGDLNVVGNDIKTDSITEFIVINRYTAATNISSRALSLKTNSTGTPTVGFGTGLEFQVQTDDTTFKQAAQIAVRSTDVTTGSEDFTMGFALMTNGATVTDKMVLDSTGKLTVNGILATNSSEDVANAAAINLTKAASYFSTGGAETATLAAGTTGQFKSLMMVADGGDMVITVTNAGWKTSGTGTITFNDIGDSCLLQYINSKWFAVGANGVVFA